jgi:uncharacterized membrane protein YbhN (UPF0104 family)
MPIPSPQARDPCSPGHTDGQNDETQPTPAELNDALTISRAMDVGSPLRSSAERSRGRDEPPLQRRALRARALTVLILAICGLTLLVAVPGLRKVLADMRHIAASWLLVAVCLELGSCFGYVVIFRQFFDRIPARIARQLAWTEMGSGALLPGGGVGSLAAGGWLMHLGGMPTRTILRRSSGLFFLTSATSVLALIGGGLLLGSGLSGHSTPLLSGAPIVAGFLAAAVAIALPSLLRHGPQRWQRSKALSALIAGIQEAETALLRPRWRLLGAIAYLGCDIAALWATLHAVGYSPPLATLLLGYIIGYLANTVPIPGGVGALEAGLVGTLVLYGAPATRTAAAVLVYHAIAFWIPSLGGLLAYREVRHELASGGARNSNPGGVLQEPATRRHPGHEPAPAARPQNLAPTDGPASASDQTT